MDWHTQAHIGWITRFLKSFAVIIMSFGYRQLASVDISFRSLLLQISISSTSIRLKKNN